MAENGEVYVAVPHTQKKKKTAVETFLAEVPQVLKPLPSQGSDKHRILSSFLSPLLFFPSLSPQLKHARPFISRPKRLSTNFFLCPLPYRGGTAKAECVCLVAKNVLLITKNGG